MVKKKKLVYTIKKLIPGNEIENGLTGLYAAVPDKGYKGHAFKIFYSYSNQEDDQTNYYYVEKEVKDWNKAERFRRFMDQWGRGTYTLGYFKMCDEL